MHFMMRNWKLNERMYRREQMQRCLLNSCKGACCLYGVWVGLEEQEKILANGKIIQENMKFENRNLDWFRTRVEEDQHFASTKVIHTTLVADQNHYGNSACIFLGMEGKCALQLASLALGLHPWALKPFYCVLHPLDLDEEGRITLDETAQLLAEEGSCLRQSTSQIPLLETFSEELKYLLGEDTYLEELKKATCLGE